MAWSADYMLSTREDIEVVRYNTVADLVMALRFKQIDKAAMERPFAFEVLNCVDGLRMLDETVATDGLVFAVNNEREDLLNELNEFFERFKYSEEKKDIFKRLNSKEGYEYHKIENIKGDRILSVGLPTDAYPYSYIDFETEEYSGSDLEVITLFANEYGYTLEFTPGIFTTIEIGIGEGEFDVAIGSFCNAAREDAEVSGTFMMSDIYMEHEIVYIEVEDFSKLKVISPLD
ncbi:MAG: transporter substrate-binding domain-containing protein [Erysipelotrichaceae bacterium]